MLVYTQVIHAQIVDNFLFSLPYQHFHRPYDYYDYILYIFINSNTK